MAPPRPAQYRCSCTSHNCGSTVDKDGLLGILRDKKTFDRHQRQDERDDRLRIQALHRSTIDQENQRLSDVLSNLSLTDPPPPAGAPVINNTPSNYRRPSRPETLINVISPITDSVETLRRDIALIASSPSVDVDDDTIDATLARLDSLERDASRAELQLNTVTKAKTSKDAAVVTLWDTTAEELSAVFSCIATLRDAWVSLRHQRDTQRSRAFEQICAIGVTQYDSCA